MARKKSKAKQQEELIHGILGLAILTALFGTFNATHSWTAAIIACGVVLAVFVTVTVLIQTKKSERLKRSGIAEIDKMDGVQFEKYLGHLFTAHGYKTQVTNASGDYGADLIITKGNKKIVVQAKRYSKNVGLKAVQEAKASIAYYSANEAWVITNSDYTVAAYDLAKSNHVRLINRAELIEMILAVNTTAATTAKAVIASNPTKEIVCPKCNANLVLRKGSKGRFYGCSNYPKCRYTQHVDPSST
ncbi:restriction endonuclease [Paenibacillus sp. ACRRX]|uniref:restriction endonuclease n=1 Tax=unclassified Paenibacillus TaxID=185978 RepID=UPI001EF510B1|nr:MULTISPECIES: restriction endonuclease [unclassified Paenibacillus]MCG7408938.1 restriction endonuclease [Paenibacillus sp. ACRRX]MDK8182151.1 restriction endonuclease [Paenibacillus sp. UMB4589-SE434]